MTELKSQPNEQIPEVSEIVSRYPNLMQYHSDNSDNEGMTLEDSARSFRDFLKTDIHDVALTLEAADRKEAWLRDNSVEAASAQQTEIVDPDMEDDEEVQELADAILSNCA